MRNRSGWQRVAWLAGFSLMTFFVLAAGNGAERKSAGDTDRGVQNDRNVGQTERRAAQQSSEPKEVELFEAIDEKKLETFVVAQNFSLLTLRVRNRTAAPLKVRVPEVFAAIPAARIMAQQMARQRGNAAGGQLPGQPYGNRGYGPQAGGRYAVQSGGSQGLGGAFYNPEPVQRLTRRGDAQAESMANDDGAADQVKDLPTLLLAPGQMLTQSLPCFCLEFGRPDPTRRIPYVLRPLKELNPDRTVRELLCLFGQKRVPQRITQIALWHTASRVPWQVLARVELPRSLAGSRRKFTLQEFQAAQTVLNSLPSYRGNVPGGMNPGLH